MADVDVSLSGSLAEGLVDRLSDSYHESELLEGVGLGVERAERKYGRQEQIP